MRLALLVPSILALLPALPVSAQTVFAGEPASVHFDSTPHVGPDALNLRYEYVGRSLAAAGGEFVLVGVKGSPGALGFSLGGLLELSNEPNALPVPSQMLRAMIFVSLLATNTEIEFSEEHRGQVYLRLGFFHESDHVSGTSNVLSKLNDEGVDLDNFSSFEYVRAAGTYRHQIEGRTTLSANLGFRLFTPSINQMARAQAAREQTFGADVELAAEFRLGEVVGVYGAIYWDGTANSLAPRRFRILEPPSFAQTFRVELGARFHGSVGAVDLYTGMVAMHGRGIDFAEAYEPTWLLGIRGSI